jgi:hypothetical protein
MEHPHKQRLRLLPALITTLAYLAVSAAAYLTASAMAATGPAYDANIGAGLIGIGPALPTFLVVAFFVDPSSNVALFVCYGINVLIAGGVAFWSTNRRAK